jgi:hypothetical protein
LRVFRIRETLALTEIMNVLNKVQVVFSEIR